MQCRILYAMQRMGLGHSGPGPAGIPKPVKRTGGGRREGRIHPHSDQAAYDALNARAQALYLSEGFV